MTRKQFFTIATCCLTTNKTTKKAAKSKVTKAANAKLKQEIESYLNKKLVKFGIAVSNFNIETEIEEV